MRFEKIIIKLINYCTCT